jgi:hypothetical protein
MKSTSNSSWSQATRRSCLGVVFLLVCLLLPLLARAYPPAPHHLFYGTVRNEFGAPINVPGTQIVLETSSSAAVTTEVASALEPGVDYRLAVPMDAGITADPYKATALRPTVPFVIRVRIGEATYLPIEMVGDLSKMGQPGERTRLNLTLGEDLDGDGLPDAWERMINQDIALVNPGDDPDKDGLNNQQEYLAGTYAFDSKDGFRLDVSRMNGETPVLEFMAIRGHTYSVLGSDNLQEWTELEFKEAGQDPTVPAIRHYTAAGVRMMQIEPVRPVDAPSVRFFKLLTQ